MSDNFQELINILGREISLYNEMHDVLQNEKDVLVHFNAEKILNVTKVKDSVANQLQCVEVERIKLMETISEDLDLNNTRLTLKNLSEFIKNEAHVSQLDTIRKDLKDIVEKCYDLNTHNTILIQNSLGLIKKTLGLLKEGLSDKGSYQAGRKVKRLQRVNLLSKKA